MEGNEIVDYDVTSVKKDLLLKFGDFEDGALEFVGIVDGGYIETSYFYGDEKPKNILVASTQVGCPSRCSFCELGNQNFVRNLTSKEMVEQSILMFQEACRHGHDIVANNKISWANSGDALFNQHFTLALEELAGLEHSHKISTVFPGGQKSERIFREVADFASEYSQPIQIQVSLISTDENYRQKSAGIKVASFEDIRDSAEYWRKKNPDGRKVNLSLILDESNPINIDEISKLFPAELFRFRFRNYVPTENGINHDLETVSEERFGEIYRMFEDGGYDVGTWATPTSIEKRFGLAPNISLRRYSRMIDGKF